jgi:hypothetical protein
MKPVVIPEMPDGFRIITRVRYGEIEAELIDFRDHSLDAFRKREYIKADSDRERQLVRYGVHVAARRCGASRRRVGRAVRYLADLAWLAASSSQDGNDA